MTAGMLLEIGSVIGGLVLLIIGADGLIRGSSGLALRFGISSLVVGLTVVAFGTSAPELVVSLNAALVGRGSMAVGNVIGSNVANIALILGLSAVISPIRAQAQLIRRDVPIMILATVVLVLMLSNGVLGRWEGLILFLFLVGYVGSAIYLSKREQDAGVREVFQQAVPAQPQKPIILLILLLLGLGLLVLGANLFVKGAIDLARRFAGVGRQRLSRSGVEHCDPVLGVHGCEDLTVLHRDTAHGDVWVGVLTIVGAPQGRRHLGRHLEILLG